jgi:hypothetical protein
MSALRIRVVVAVALEQPATVNLNARITEDPYKSLPVYTGFVTI